MYHNNSNKQFSELKYPTLITDLKLKAYKSNEEDRLFYLRNFKKEEKEKEKEIEKEEKEEKEKKNKEKI